jgi:hypothetical protein
MFTFMLPETKPFDALLKISLACLDI